MSSPAQIAAPECVCYVHCNFCNTILVVSVPSGNALGFVTVRCGHCANLLAVNMAAMLQNLDHQVNYQNHAAPQNSFINIDYGSSSKCNWASSMIHSSSAQQQMLPIRPPEKRQRAPSAYNNFIKEEIQRIKATNPDISHREAFSTAAKNWAHFPRIHFGLTLEGSNQVKLDDAIAAARGNVLHKSQGFF